MVSDTLNIMNDFIYLRDYVYLCVVGKDAPYVLPYTGAGNQTQSLWKNRQFLSHSPSLQSLE